MNPTQIISPEASLTRYLSEIQKFPMLEAQEEYVLAKKWRDEQDRESARKLVTAHLRLVAKIARGYRGYGLPPAEIISEGNVGLMQAVKRFDPDKGARLSTYAIFWIRASIQEYVLRSWSLVKIGSTAAQKKLFFGLRRVKRDLALLDSGELTPDQAQKIATRLDVPEEDVVSMNRRLSGGDQSLNTPVRGEEDGEWQDWLADESANQEASLEREQEIENRRRLLVEAMKVLSSREHRILTARRLQERPATLEELAQEMSVSRERIRQIEVKALEKLRRATRRRLASRRDELFKSAQTPL